MMKVGQLRACHGVRAFDLNKTARTALSLLPMAMDYASSLLSAFISPALAILSAYFLRAGFRILRENGLANRTFASLRSKHFPGVLKDTDTHTRF